MTFKQIILIDDDLAVNYYHRYIIEHENLAESIQVADNVDDGMQLLFNLPEKPADNGKINLILLDINMPKYTGFELLEKYPLVFERAASLGFHTIILTTSDNPKDLATAEQFPIIKGYLQKPLTAEKLISIKKSIVQ